MFVFSGSKRDLLVTCFELSREMFLGFVSSDFCECCVRCTKYLALTSASLHKTCFLIKTFLLEVQVLPLKTPAATFIATKQPTLILRGLALAPLCWGFCVLREWKHFHPFVLMCFLMKAWSRPWELWTQPEAPRFFNNNFTRINCTINCT